MSSRRSGRPRADDPSESGAPTRESGQQSAKHYARVNPHDVTNTEADHTSLGLPEPETTVTSPPPPPEPLEGDDSVEHLSTLEQAARMAAAEARAAVRFELSSCTAPIANGLRRTLIADVESMAIELVSLESNSSCVYDEDLALRIGLIPLKVDPFLFQRPPPGLFSDGPDGESASASAAQTIVPGASGNGPSDGPPELSAAAQALSPISASPSFDPSTDAPSECCIIFDIDVTGATSADVTVVASKHLTFHPLPGQLAKGGVLANAPTPVPVHADITIAKLKPGQRIKARCVAVRGCGRQHAKWSPVCTAAYRMRTVVRVVQQPRIAALHDIEDAGNTGMSVDGAAGKPLPASALRRRRERLPQILHGDVEATAENIRDLCPVGVFELVNEEGEGPRLVAQHPDRCTVCRACVEKFPSHVDVSLDKSRFAFSVESTGAISAVETVRRGYMLLIERLRTARYAVQSGPRGPMPTSGEL
eukprot:TRINITY_DN33083_c0_g1_i1.p1 TRINITY_DN33083_c0_g1~~TRINITY_DN33083_c0_g1_i1.p1  ORF type:complete len:478 (-),score=100.14 TRINITY_DN33083_c0_g1_i1:81-1514(-)